MKKLYLYLSILLIMGFATSISILGQHSATPFLSHRSIKGLNQSKTIKPQSLGTPVRVNNDLLGSDTDLTAQLGTQTEPYIHANPSNPNNLVAGWQENRFATGGARSLNFASSMDGGRTWKEGLLPKLTKLSGGIWDIASDPWIAFGANNQVYYVSLVIMRNTSETGILVSRSTDGGMTWGSPVEVIRSKKKFNDKEAITVDTFPSSPFFGNVYVSWDTNTSDKQILLFSGSSDNGQSFSKPVKIRSKGSNIGVIPAIGPSGTIYLAWTGTGSGLLREEGEEFSNEAKKPLDKAKKQNLASKIEKESQKVLQQSRIGIYFTKSTDGGKTWAAIKRIADLIPDGISAARTGDILSSFAVDPVTEKLYVAWADSRWTGKDLATIISSSDKGASWTTPQRISDGSDNANDFTIAVAANSDSEVAVSYYSLRDDPERRFLAKVYAQVSRDGGKTFEPAQQITPQAFDIRFAAIANGLFFLGDYRGLTANGSGFHLLWVDTTRKDKDGRFQSDVFSLGIE